MKIEEVTIAEFNRAKSLVRAKKSFKEIYSRMSQMDGLPLCLTFDTIDEAYRTYRVVHKQVRRKLWNFDVCFIKPEKRIFIKKVLFKKELP